MFANTLRLAALLTVVTFATPSVSAAQPWKTQINDQLLASPSVRRLINNDYTITHDPFYSVLRAFDGEYMTVNLRAGTTYHLIGKCDNDCSDLDFRLYDESGTLVSRDTAADDYPMVSVTPYRSGTYRLRVDMAKCTTRDCGWGVVVLGK